MKYGSTIGNYFPIDDSPFTNEYYTPSYSEYFYDLESATRKALNERNVLTSDGISESTLRDIYQRCYVHRFINGTQDLLALLPNRTVAEVTEDRVGGWRSSETSKAFGDYAGHVAASSDSPSSASAFSKAGSSFAHSRAKRLPSRRTSFSSMAIWMA